MARSLHLSAYEKAVILAVRASNSPHRTVVNNVAVAVTKTTSKVATCATPTCYKYGHAFSQKGAYGDGTVKGHFDLNPTHSAKSI